MAYPSTDSGAEGLYRSDCSDIEFHPDHQGSLDWQLRFRYSTAGDFYPAENGFKLRAAAGGTWFYATVHDPYGPFFGSTGDETVNEKQCLYMIMDAQRDATRG